MGRVTEVQLISIMYRMICVATLISHHSTVAALSFSPDSRFTTVLTFHTVNLMVCVGTL